MEFVDVDGENMPYVMYKPYMYKKIVDCSRYYTIFHHNYTEINFEFKKENDKMKENNNDLENIDILKVSNDSNPNAIAGLLTQLIKKYGKAEMQGIGAGALNQSIKSIAIARGFLAPSGYNIVCIPAFTEIEVEGEKRTAIKLIVRNERI
jgi:stage V sporulation protein S